MNSTVACHVDDRLAKKWKDLSGGRPFLLKGIQDPEDAIKAMECGCDGVVVSNHAGRQVDGAVGSLDMLPEVRADTFSYSDSRLSKVSQGLWTLKATRTDISYRRQGDYPL